MNSRRTANESETESDSTRSDRTSQVEAGSNDAIGQVASLHGAAGNQAVQSFVDDERRGGSGTEPDGEAQEGSGTVSQSWTGTPIRETSVQPKLTVSAPNDEYEREAERVATRILRQSAPTSTPTHGSGGGGPSATGSPPAVTGAVPGEVEQAIAGGGRPLSASARSFFEPRFGRDLGDVRVHTDSRADEAARTINAEAFTVGNHIAFRSDSYQPGTRDGKRLLAHELVHTIQQGAVGERRTTGDEGVAPRTEVGMRARATVQRLIKSDTPWTGAVVDTPSLAMREDPQVKSGPNENTLADLPRETLVTVVGTSGQWLELQVDTTQDGVVLNQRARRQLSGDTLRGYSYHEYIDDAVAAKMSDLVGEKARWIGSWRGGTNTFAQWASASSESDAPPVERTTTINCWEMILLAAYRIGAVDWTSIHDLYTSSSRDWEKELQDKMTSGPRTPYDASTRDQLERGDVVFFRGVDHVTLATGNGDEVLTFWPPPNTDIQRNAAGNIQPTLDAVKTSTISDLRDWMEARLGPIDVTFASPGWHAW